jgi:hypothetical protein
MEPRVIRVLRVPQDLRERMALRDPLVQLVRVPQVHKVLAEMWGLEVKQV